MLGNIQGRQPLSVSICLSSKYHVRRCLVRQGEVALDGERNGIRIPAEIQEKREPCRLIIILVESNNCHSRQCG